MNKLLLTFIFIIYTLTLKAQTSSDKAITLLKSFYTAYMSEFSIDQDSRVFERKLSELRKKYCTKTCIKQYEKLADETDADPLIEGQDSGKEFLKSLTIKRNLKKPNLYTISYIGDIYTHELVTINLIVINQHGVLKIASIE